MKIVVGLGNYGDKYAYTYHNLGFLAVEAVADCLGLKFRKKECDCLLATGYIRGKQIVLAKPLTFMNLSGKAVYQLMRKYDVQPKDVLIIFDDIDIEKGKIRIRQSGSGGTHNGMKNIIEITKSEDFPRVRIGMGPKPEFVPLFDYVLSDIPSSERQMYMDVFAEVVENVRKMLEIEKQ